MKARNREPDELEPELDGRMAQALRDSAEHLDAPTRSRLNRARQAALAQIDRPRYAAPVGAAAVTAALAVLAVSLWRAEPPVPEAGTPVAAAAGPDAELLLAEEDLEMLEDLEFYVWLAGEDVDTGRSG